MPKFSCKMLNERGAIVSSADITAENLEAAIGRASALLHTSNQSVSSRRVYSFEVWSGTSRLFPSELEFSSDDREARTEGDLLPATDRERPGGDYLRAEWPPSLREGLHQQAPVK
jgi:hypothetical protein